MFFVRSAHACEFGSRKGTAFARSVGDTWPLISLLLEPRKRVVQNSLTKSAKGERPESQNLHRHRPERPKLADDQLGPIEDEDEDEAKVLSIRRTERAAMKIGYARVSTDEQNLDLQRQALDADGCAHIHEDPAFWTIALRTGVEELERQFREIEAECEKEAEEGGYTVIFGSPVVILTDDIPF